MKTRTTTTMLECYDEYSMQDAINRLSLHRLFENIENNLEKAENLFDMIILAADVNEDLFCRWDGCDLLNAATMVLHHYDVFSFENVNILVDDWLGINSYCEKCRVFSDVYYNLYKYDIEVKSFENEMLDCDNENKIDCLCQKKTIKNKKKKIRLIIKE